MTTLFENYELFLKEHSHEINSPSDSLRLIADTSMFRSYTDALTEHISDPDIRNNVLNICNRQRGMILTEAANVPASAFGFGWTVLSLPILVDIYAEPIISKLCNVFTSDSPIVSIPRIRVRATTMKYDGTTVERKIPESHYYIRPDFEERLIPPSVPFNLLQDVFGANAKDFKMNRRYLMVDRVELVCTSAGGASVSRVIPVTFRPDSRAQFIKEFKFMASDNLEVTATFQGHVTWDTGSVFYQIVINDDGGTTDTNIAVTGANFIARFVPIRSMLGRTKISIKTEMTDLTIDPNEDFLIDLTQEEVQDYQSIFKYDLARTMSDAIKRQIMLNKDQDLSFFLQSSQGEIADFGASATIDFQLYRDQGGQYSPATVIHVLQNIAPKIAYVSNRIKDNFQMYPTFVITGRNTATMLQSLQEMMVSMPTSMGELGFTGSVGSFMKMEILSSPAIPDNDIYISTKAPQDALEKSSILDLIYKPIYIVSEIDQGNAITFVRSRTMIEIARTDGLGYIKCLNLEPLLA